MIHQNIAAQHCRKTNREVLTCQNKRIIQSIFLMLGLSCFSTPSWTQSIKLTTPPEYFLGNDPHKLPTYSLPDKEDKPFSLPILPRLPESHRLSEQLEVFVKNITLTGNHTISSTTLHPIITPYEQRLLTSEDIQTLRHKLTLYYINQGYINSGVIIPDQEVKQGNLQLQVIEGQLNKIRISGNEGINSGYITKRFMLGSEQTLNIHKLQQRIQLLQQNILIKKINAELKPGNQLGESILEVIIEENKPYHMGMSFNNHRSPAVGGLQGEIWGVHHNLTGNGDPFDARFNKTEGLDEVHLAYSLPLNAYDTTLNIYFAHSEATVVETPFDDLKIKSKLNTFGIALNQPLYRTQQQSLNAGIVFERHMSETYLRGQPYSFQNDIDNQGRTRISVLRLAQEWLDRSQKQVFAVRSLFSVGINAFGITKNHGNTPNGTFFTWLGQAQWTRRLWNSNNQVVLRSDIQLSADRLLPLEKFSIGGHTTVRGYRENRFVRDNGWVGSIELRIPTLRFPIPSLSQRSTDGMLIFAPFYDLGYSWNSHQNDPGPDNISSLGLGLRWAPHPNIHSNIYWGIALRDVGDEKEHDIQDSGITFSLDISY